VESVHLCFDHHVSEVERVGPRPNLIIDPWAPSAARVVYNHYGGERAFPAISKEMMEAVDRADSARYTAEEILAPTGWALLNFVMDERTGIDRFGRFALPRDDLMRALIVYCRHNPIAEILAHPDIADRVNTYALNAEFWELQLNRCSRVHGKVVVTDLRNEDPIYPGNRFMVYALHPSCTVSVQARPGVRAGETMIAVGKSIIDRSATVNLGSLMLKYGGGGHAGAGACRVPDGDAERVLGELVERIGREA
jgi:nanoRNase/pAp phosphatase (c-di-AMP/oligoRNAs hydrolase)